MSGTHDVTSYEGAQTIRIGSTMANTEAITLIRRLFIYSGNAYKSNSDITSILTSKFN